MIVEKSCGAVVYTVTEEGIRYIIIQSKTGFYGFPKGHMENDETETETALREVMEETGLLVTLDPDFRTADHHRIPLGQDAEKEVIYFLGYYEGQTPVFTDRELSGGSLYSYDEAVKLLRFENSKKILTEADDHLKAQGKGNGKV